MKTFSVIRRVQVLYLVIFLLCFALTGFMAYLPFGIFTSFSNALGQTRSPSSHLWILFLIWSVPFLLLTIWMGIYLIAIRKARLIFDDQALGLESINHFKFLIQRGLKPFKLSYDQIKNVRLGGLAGIVEIIDLKGKKTILIPAIFGGNYGEEVLVELRSRLPVENFESGMEASDIRRKWSKGNKARAIFSSSILVIYISTLLFDPLFSSRSWLTNAWQAELRPIWYENVWTYSLDGRDNFFRDLCRLGD